MGIIKQIIEEPGYFARRNGIFGVGKHIAHEVAHPVGETLGQTLLTPDLVGQFGSIGLGLGRNAVGLTTIGLTAAVSAGMVQVDYYHQRSSLKEFYKEELTAQLKKSPGKVTTSDLDTLAKGDPAKGIAGNRTIAEELGKSRRERNAGIAFSFLASMAALAVVYFAVPTLLSAVGLPDVPQLSKLFTSSAAGWGALAVSMGVGLVTYNVVKAPLHWLGDKLFGLDKETTHDRIKALQHEHAAGRAISREQVLSVFTKANPQLEHFIHTEYGASYDKLGFLDKQHATEEVAKMVPLDHLADDINSGKVNATELAFAVEGKISGVEHTGEREPKNPGMFGSMWAKVRHAVSSRSRTESEYTAVASAVAAATASASAETEEQDPAKASFVKRLGLTKMNASLGHVARLDQQAVNSPISQTIQ